MTSKIDDSISAKLQASSINFNYYIKKLFGKEFGVDKQLGLAIQFSPITPTQKEFMTNDKVSNNVKSFISEFEDVLSDQDIASPKYAYRVQFTPVNVNKRGQADQVVNFIKLEDSTNTDNLDKKSVYLKEVEKKKYTPTQIVLIMKDEGYEWFTINKMNSIWQEKGNRQDYGVECAGRWFWYDNWIPIVRKYCKENDAEIPQNRKKEGYYAAEIVTEMHSKDFALFGMRDFTIFWRDVMKIDKNNTEYGYEMHDKRFIWKKEFLSLVENYCQENDDKFYQKYE